MIIVIYQIEGKSEYNILGNYLDNYRFIESIFSENPLCLN